MVWVKVLLRSGIRFLTFPPSSPQPVLLHQDLEALDCPIVGVHNELRQRAYLSCPVPTVRAVHEAADTPPANEMGNVDTSPQHLVAVVEPLRAV